MKKIYIRDLNEGLIEKIKSLDFPSYTNFDIAVGDAITLWQETDAVIVSASNPSFTMGGGLDADIKALRPDDRPTHTNHLIGDVLYCITVDESLQSNYDLVFAAIRDANTLDRDVIITGLGTGIGHLHTDTFCRALMHGVRSFCNASVSGSARVYGSAWVYGDAYVSGNTHVNRSAKVYGDARVLTGYIQHGESGGDNIISSISHQLGVLPDSEGFYTFYKRVNKNGDTYVSCHDVTFIYVVGEYAEADAEVSHKSCAAGLHVSSLHYWNQGSHYIECKVHIDDIITCQEGKVRCRKLFVTRDVTDLL